MSYYHYQFTGIIERHSMGFNRRGELFYSVLFVPDVLRRELPLKQYPRLRIDGEMHDMPFEAALQPAKGRSYLLISQAFMREHQLNLGDEVVVRFNIGDHDFVDVPDALQQALDANEAAGAKWSTLTPGKKRGYATQVASAKRKPTQIARAQKMIELIQEDKDAGGRPI